MKIQKDLFRRWKLYFFIWIVGYWILKNCFFDIIGFIIRTKAKKKTSTPLSNKWNLLRAQLIPNYYYHYRRIIKQFDEWFSIITIDHIRFVCFLIFNIPLCARLFNHTKSIVLMKTKCGMQRTSDAWKAHTGYRFQHMLKLWACRSFTMPRVQRHTNLLFLCQSNHEFVQCFGWPLAEIALRYASLLPIATSLSSNLFFFLFSLFLLILAFFPSSVSLFSIFFRPEFSVQDLHSLLIIGCTQKKHVFCRNI